MTTQHMRRGWVKVRGCGRETEGTHTYIHTNWCNKLYATAALTGQTCRCRWEWKWEWEWERGREKLNEREREERDEGWAAVWMREGRLFADALWGYKSMANAGSSWTVMALLVVYPVVAKTRWFKALLKHIQHYWVSLQSVNTQSCIQRLFLVLP